ncbi:MAG TPA: hypothetical protein DD670_18980 [Planctomycetaceae bacterium]|nr:hypothetical protein [Planctomycetaceae bacterium]
MVRTAGRPRMARPSLMLRSRIGQERPQRPREESSRGRWLNLFVAVGQMPDHGLAGESLPEL